MKKIASLLLITLILILTTLSAVADFSYTVQPGDTLFSIARRYDTTVSAIAGINSLVNPNIIYVGQVLLIPTAGEGPVTPPPTPTPPPSNPPPAPPPTNNTTYTVQPGDTLTRIAIRFGVTVQALLQANNLVNANFLFVGQQLIIPGTAVSNPTPLPAPPPTQPPTSTNLLLNGSFEEAWYHPGNIPELQVPQHWILEWDVGPTGFGNAAYDIWVRPESRVLPSAFLPPAEHPLFIYEGDRTLKIFKGNGATSFRLLQDVALQPGTYQFTINFYPDVVTHYSNGNKIAPTDPFAGEMRFIIGSSSTGWSPFAYLQKNTMTHTFAIYSAQTIRLGVGIRGKYAIQNNGWFMDDWSLVQLQ